MPLFVVFLLAYMLSQFYRSFLAVIAPGLAAELGLTAGDLANVSAAWFVVFALAQFPLGIALDRIGPRRSVPVPMLAAVAGALLLARAQGPVACIVANGLIGLGCSPIYMGALYYFGRMERPERFGFICACMLGLGSLGNLLAATPLALAAQHFGWRTTFVGIAALTLASAALFWIMVRDPPPAERPEQRVSGTAADGSGAGPSARAGLLEILTLPGLWTLMPLMMLGYAAIVVERGLWVGPYFAEVHQLDPVGLGNAALAMAAAMSAGALLFGFADRVFRQRKRLVIAGSLLTSGGFAVLALTPRPSLALATLTMAAVGFMGLHQPLVFAHARTFFPEHLLGRGMTFANFLTIGGAGLVQWVSGSYVTHLQQTGTAAPDVYAALHLAFAIIILAATLIYMWSPTPSARQAQP